MISLIGLIVLTTIPVGILGGYIARGLIHDSVAMKSDLLAVFKLVGGVVLLLSWVFGFALCLANVMGHGL